LLIVATASAVDHAKPVSIFVHELLGLAASCRAYEIKHACYGGTAALMTATEWIASGVARGRKALVVASDIAKYPPHSAGEPTQGAGAVAMVVAESPGLLALDVGASGVHAANVYDFWRPLDRSQALVDGKYSLDCYLAALAGAFAEYRRRAADRPPRGDPLPHAVSAHGVEGAPRARRGRLAHPRRPGSALRGGGRGDRTAVLRGEGRAVAVGGAGGRQHVHGLALPLPRGAPRARRRPPRRPPPRHVLLRERLVRRVLQRCRRAGRAAPRARDRPRRHAGAPPQRHGRGVRAPPCDRVAARRAGPRAPAAGLRGPVLLPR